MTTINRSIVVSAVIATLSPVAHATDTYPASGRVNTVDTTHSEVNITHGPIAGLGWPGMTMTFQVMDRAATKQLKAGEPIKFWLEKRDGHYVIVKITPATEVK